MRIDELASNLGFTEGPVWLPDGRIALTSISHGCVYVVDPDGAPIDRIITGGGPNGLALDPGGALYVAQNGGVFGASGTCPAGVQVVLDGRVEYLATGMEAPNDLVFGPDGRLWVTDTRVEPDFAAGQFGVPGGLWACPVDGSQPTLIVDDGPVFINGLAFADGGSSLLVTATLSSQLLAYPVGPDGAPPWTQSRLVHTFDNGWPDGMAVDASGRAWVALTAADRVDVIDESGCRCALVELPPGSLPTNVCVGGPKLDELYITAAHAQALLRVRFDEGDSLRPGGRND